MSSEYLVSEVMDAMNEIAPKELALEWDHVGLMIGDVRERVKGVLLALDVNHAAVDAAIDSEANMIIAHHPLFFKPLKEIDYGTARGSLVRKLVKNDIHVFAAHTNLDLAKQGVNQALAKELGLVMPMTLQGAEVGICGSVGSQETSLMMYAELVKAKLGASGVIMNTDEDRPVSRVFLQGGAFEEESIPTLINANVEVVVTGEMKHHIMMELEDCGIAAIVAGHEVTERIVLPSVKKQLLRKLPNLTVTVFEGHKW